MNRRGNMEARALALVALFGLVACDGNINLFGSPTQVQGPSADRKSTRLNSSHT